MGNFAISITGVGSHHNGSAKDVEQMAHKFVADLKAAGHSVTSAVTTTGGALHHQTESPQPIEADLPGPTPTGGDHSGDPGPSQEAGRER